MCNDNPLVVVVVAVVVAVAAGLAGGAVAVAAVLRGALRHVEVRRTAPKRTPGLFKGMLAR